MQDPVSNAAPVPGNSRLALTSVFLSPTRAFQEVARGAGFLLPFLVTSVMAIAGSLLTRPLQQAIADQRLSQLSDAQREAAAGQAGVMRVTQIASSFLMPLAILLGLLVSAGFFLLALRAAGAKVQFKPVLRGLAYASVIGGGLYQLLSGLLIQFKARSSELAGMEDVPRLGLDLLGGDGMVRGILGTFNIFSIWWLVVIVFGFAALTGRKVSQIGPVVGIAGIVWLLLLGLMNGLSLKFAGA